MKKVTNAISSALNVSFSSSNEVCQFLDVKKHMYVSKVNGRQSYQDLCSTVSTQTVK